MADYSELKEKLVNHKEKVLFAVCAVVIFLVGFGTGRAQKQPKSSTQQYSQYTANTAPKQAPAKEADANTGQVAGAATNTGPATPAGESPEALAKAGQCVIKGTASKIYHVKGGQFYARVTKPVACFKTESEAQAAGYRKSSR